MMKRLSFISLFWLLGLAGWAQGADGSGAWWGKLKVQGTELTLVFHLIDDSCTVDSPDQGATGIPATLQRTPMGVKVAIPAVNASYEGVFFRETLTGTLQQSGLSLPLTLRPGMPRRHRPQTPAAPFPYQAQEVSFHGVGDAVLKGTLTLPSGFTRSTPVLLMVTGSGQQNRDEEIFEHKPFAVLADALARQGIATLRYDDRGFGKSTGSLTGITTDDLKNDALAGVELLRQQFDRVGVLGHSEGGTIGLMLAAEGQVDFVVSLAGNVVSGAQTLLEQNRWALSQAGYSDEVTTRYCQALEQLFSALKEGRNPEPATDGLSAPLAQNLQAVKAQCSSPWMRYFLTLDMTPRLGSITCPVLALNGTSDRQVSAAENLEALRQGLSGEKELHALEGLNHLFQHCTTGDPSEYKDIEETFAPEALELIVNWLKK